MLPVIDIDNLKISNWNELQEIKFKFTVKNRVKNCETIITFDTENSSGVVHKGKVFKYNKQFAETKEGEEFYHQCEKTSITYIWSLAIETGIEEEPVKVFIGRTWNDFKIFMYMLTTEIGLQSIIKAGLSSWNYRKELFKNVKKQKGYRKPTWSMYIHNLPYDFQFMRNILEDSFTGKYEYKNTKSPVFAREPRKPMRAVFSFNKTRVILKDTLVLTQKSLANWCKDSKLPVSKLTVPEGYYDEIRTPITKLTDFDIKYSAADVVSMIYGIDKYREKYGSLYKIPMTQTGEVRRVCQNHLKETNPEWCKKCAEIMGTLTLNDFRILCEIFAGGWTHANVTYTSTLLHDVRCFDFASSYPFAMCGFKYPVSAFIKMPLKTVAELNLTDPRSLDINYKYIVRVRARNIKSKLLNTFWSSSKCLALENPIVDNGRILQAEYLECYMCDLDYHMFLKTYEGDIEVIEIYRAEADFLPRELILIILDYYGKKTSLKGLEDVESLYLESKQFINSIYGVAVTKTISDEVQFIEENNEGISGWNTVPLTEEMYDKLRMKNYDKNGEPREDIFLHFAIGCFVTAYARNNLWYLICKLDQNVAYGDTDSLKGPFEDKDIEIIKDYNKWVKTREEEVAARLNFDSELFAPVTSKGKHKRLGIFEEEDTAIEFKTLGAKRYCNSIKIPKEQYNPSKHKLVRFEGDYAIILEVTVAGLPKKSGVRKFKTVDEFTPEVHWSHEESGKKVSYYIDDGKTNLLFTDLNGKTYTGGNKYGICILPTTFDMTLAKEYTWLIDLIENAGAEELEKVPKLLKEGLI